MLYIFSAICKSKKNQNSVAHVACLSSNQAFGYSSKRVSRLYSSLEKFTYEGTYSIFQSSSVQHWFKNWKDIRRGKLTASTFAGAIAFWPKRRTQLWLEKLGVIEPFPGNIATSWSNLSEKKALESYRLITEVRSILFPGFQVYKGDPGDEWLAASPDGIINSDRYKLGVLEIKCPLKNGNKNETAPWSRIPLYYIPQAQGLMEIMNMDWMHLYCWTPKPDVYSLFKIYRDAEYWKILKTALSDFWWNHVQPAREFCRHRVVKDPLYELRSFRPAPKHSLCRDIIKESRQIVNNSEKLWPK